MFSNLISSKVEKNKQPNGSLLNLAPNQSKTLGEDDLRNLFFGDYLKSTKESETATKVAAKTYEEITDLDKLKQVIENYLSEFNLTSKVPMDLVIFGFIIEHISRVSRIIKQGNGHGLLIGIGGSGRSSATKMAAFMADYELFQIEVSKKYGFTEWRNDLKSLLRKAGEQGKNVVFLFCDHQIKDEAFLEDINMLLNSGDIPSLFENEERLEIIEHVGSKIY